MRKIPCNASSVCVKSGGIFSLSACAYSIFSVSSMHDIRRTAKVLYGHALPENCGKADRKTLVRHFQHVELLKVGNVTFLTFPVDLPQHSVQWKLS